MDETKKTTDSIVSSPGITASSITPTAATRARPEASDKTPAEKKRTSTASSKPQKAENSGLKKLIEKMEKLRVEMNDVSTWTEMIATEISDFIVKASPVAVPTAVTPAVADNAKEKKKPELDTTIFSKMLNSLVDIKGTSFATSSIVIDLYRPVVAIANDIGLIANMMVQDSELADARRKQEEENRREFIALLEKIGERSVVEKEKPEKDEGGGFGLGAFAALLGGIASGFIIGLAKELGLIFTNIIKAVKESKLGKAIGGFIDDLANSFARTISKFKESIGKIISKTGGLLTAVGNKISAAVTGVRTFFTFVVEAFKPVQEAFRAVASKFGVVKDLIKGATAAGNSIGVISGIFNAVQGTFASIVKSFQAFFQLGQSLGSLAGKVFGFLGKLGAKLFLPLTILIGLWDFFKGFTSTEGSFTDKFKEGMIKLVNGLVGWIVDIPKSIISWIAGMLGFTEIEKALDSFKFEDVLRNLVEIGEKIFTGIFDFFFNALPEFIGKVKDSIVGYFMDGLEGWKSIFGAFKDMLFGKINFVDFFKKIVAGLIQVLLAPVNALGKIVGFDITKKALDMLGLGGEASGDSGGAVTQSTPAPSGTQDSSSDSDALKRIDSYAATLKPTTALDKRLIMEDGRPYDPATAMDKASVLYRQGLEARKSSDPNLRNPLTRGAALLAAMPIDYGRELNETSQATQAMKDAAAAANNAPVVDASNRTAITNNNQSVTYGAGLSIPDRTGFIFKASPYGI